MLETAAFGRWKAKEAIEWFHGIGRLVGKDAGELSGANRRAAKRGPDGPTNVRAAASVISRPSATRSAFPWFEFISGGLGKLVGPSVDDGMAIDVVDAGHDALLEFVL